MTKPKPKPAWPPKVNERMCSGSKCLLLLNQMSLFVVFSSVPLAKENPILFFVKPIKLWTSCRTQRQHIKWNQSAVVGSDRFPKIREEFSLSQPRNSRCGSATVWPSLFQENKRKKRLFCFWQNSWMIFQQNTGPFRQLDWLFQATEARGSRYTGQQEARRADSPPGIYTQIIRAGPASESSIGWQPFSDWAEVIDV